MRTQVNMRVQPLVVTSLLHTRIQQHSRDVVAIENGTRGRPPAKKAHAPKCCAFFEKLQ
jgi:hypothetical protein